VLLVLTALCAQREVIISRGELIEIGGEFRMPDVMATSGATLVDVGTTNRTHLSDYERALSDNTAAILKVHPSNYRVVGFTSSVTGSELAHLAHERNTLFLHDLGSGLIQAPPEAEWAGAEPTLEMALSDGADLVTFSGDKLLGGPQAGLIVGRADLIRRCSQHPLARALRVDKMTLAALEKTIELLLDNRARDLPLWRMALAPAAEIETRARAVAERVKSHLSQSDVKVEVVPTRAVTGGGSLPETSVSSWSILLSHGETSSDELARALRSDDPAVIGRIEEDRVLLDLRTVPAEDDDVLTAAIRRALGS
jgi:L-seryl-tRNA(Ser) seleniumtransferase